MQTTSSSTSAYPKIVSVVGVTASGKSELGMQLAKEYCGEVICADSRTVYEGMDIGTAKPTKNDQKLVSHHLLDIVRPGERFTVAQFKKQALESIKKIVARGHLPLLVGGTGLYVDSVIFDYSFQADNDRAPRREQLESYSIDRLVKLLENEHIQIPQNEKNKRYLIRALERGGNYTTDRQHIRPNTLVLGIQRSQPEIRARLELRLEQMFGRGLRREVDQLVHEFGWDSEALTGIGYREFKGYYDGELSMSQVKRRIIQDDLIHVRHQRTWFKRNPYIEWVDNYEEASSKVKEFLATE